MTRPPRPARICFVAVALLFPLRPASSALAQERPTAIEGIVYDDYDGDGRQDSNERPVPGIRIAVLDGTSGDLLVTRNGADVEVQTDAHGHYRYESTGHLDVRLRPFDPDAITMYNPHGWLETNPIERRVRVTNGSVASNIDIGYMAARQTTVEGLVFEDFDQDGQQDRGETPMPGVRLAVLDGPSGNQLMTRSGADIEIHTESDGRYRYETLGSIDVRLRPFDRAAITTDNRRGWLESKPTERRIQVTNGTVMADADFGVASFRQTVVEGHVFDDRDGDGQYDAGERGFRGVRIAVLDGPTGNILADANGATIEVQTDAEGHFRFEKRGSLDIRLRPFDPGNVSSNNRRGWLSTIPTERRLQVPNGSTVSDADFAY